jgi:hypothetical protein
MSNSIAGAAGTESSVSGELTRFPRVTMNTWSFESMQVPATSPVDHGLGLPVDVLITSGVPQSPALGNGIFGHDPSGTNFGILGLLGGSAWVPEIDRPTAAATANPTAPAKT